MNALILYKSKYGCSKQYAQWLNSEINSDIFELDKCPSLNNYNLIILGGGIYFGKINGSSFISKSWDSLKNKKIILFSTSEANPQDQLIKKFYENSVPEKIRKQVLYFPLDGACVYERLTWTHKTLSFIGSIFQKDPIQKNEMRYGFNRVKKENIDQIIDCVKKTIL